MRQAFPFSFELDRKSLVPLANQIRERLRDHIVGGHLRPGTRLPSARQLAVYCEVSRITTENAYRYLQLQGYIHRRAGSGTYVANILPATESAVRRHRRQRKDVSLSSTGRMLTVAEPFAQASAVPFPHSVPDLGSLPAVLRRLTRRRLTDDALFDVMAYGDPAGLRSLRQAIAGRILAHRGVRVSADQVLVTSGAQEAFNLCARLLLDPGDEAWVEDPCYPPAVAAFRSFGIKVVPVPVDDEGLAVSAGLKASPTGRLAYITPSRQYPLGVAMSMQRRKQLLEWAAARGAWIIEDDYDAELGYLERPLETLKSLDTPERVILVGTFSGTLFPALRLGYMVLPEKLVDPFLRAKRISSHPAPSVFQGVLEDLISEGAFERHVRSMKNIYRERAQVLLDASRTHWQEFLDLQPPTGGLFALGWLKSHAKDEDISARLTAHGMAVRPVSPLYINQTPRNGLLIGFAALPPGAMASAARIMSNIMRLAGR